MHDIERTCGMREFAVPAGLGILVALGVVGVIVLVWVIAR